MKLILIGFMGSGKTTVGRLCSIRYNIPLIDTDSEVERIAGKTIPEIFTSEGEIGFRERELEVSKRIADKTNCIISTGGGMVLNALNISYLRTHSGIVVYLNAPFEVIVEHVKKERATRPLFQHVDDARALYTRRLPLYEYHADFTLMTSGKTPEEICDKLSSTIGI